MDATHTINGQKLENGVRRKCPSGKGHSPKADPHRDFRVANGSRSKEVVKGSSHGNRHRTYRSTFASEGVPPGGHSGYSGDRPFSISGGVPGALVRIPGRRAGTMAASLRGPDAVIVPLVRGQRGLSGPGAGRRHPRYCRGRVAAEPPRASLRSILNKCCALLKRATPLSNCKLYRKRFGKRSPRLLPNIVVQHVKKAMNKDWNS